MVEELARWGKTIPRDRDRAQSRILLWTVGALVGLSALFPPLTALLHGLSLRSFTAPLLISVGFALLVWALRAATSAAAAMGSLICFILARPRHIETHHDPLSTEHSALLALITLFVLTFAATKFGRRRRRLAGSPSREAVERHRKSSPTSASQRCLPQLVATQAPSPPWPKPQQILFRRRSGKPSVAKRAC